MDIFTLFSSTITFLIKKSRCLQFGRCHSSDSIITRDTVGEALVMGIGVAGGWGVIRVDGGCDEGACDGGERGGCSCEGGARDCADGSGCDGD